jgi:hypothetical protein
MNTIWADWLTSTFHDRIILNLRRSRDDLGSSRRTVRVAVKLNIQDESRLLHIGFDDLVAGHSNEKEPSTKNRLAGMQR